MNRTAQSLDQAGVRIFLLTMFAGVLYVFGSLAVLVLTARSYCEHRLPIAAFAFAGLLFMVSTVVAARNRPPGARIMFVLPVTFFLLGTGIPGWISLHALEVCAAGVGR